MSTATWYHGGDLHNDGPKGTYLYVTPHLGLATANVKPHAKGRLYRLRAEFDHLVMGHHDGGDRTVIRQSDLLLHGGALAVFEEAV